MKLSHSGLMAYLLWTEFSDSFLDYDIILAESLLRMGPETYFLRYLSFLMMQIPSPATIQSRPSAYDRPGYDPWLKGPVSMCVTFRRQSIHFNRRKEATEVKGSSYDGEKQHKNKTLTVVKHVLCAECPSTLATYELRTKLEFIQCSWPM